MQFSKSTFGRLVTMCSDIKVLQRFLDPRTQIALIITVSGLLIQSSMTGTQIILNILLLSVPIIFLLSGRQYKKALFYTGLFAANCFLAISIIPKVSTRYAIFLSTVTALCIKVMPGIILGFYIMSTIEAADLIAALEKTHMPKAVIWTISIVFRFFPTVKEELSATMDGIRVRGYRTSIFFLHPVDALTYVFVPLIVSVVCIGDELLRATLTKGFSIHGKRTSLSEPKLKGQDYLVMCLLLGAWILHFILK